MRFIQHVPLKLVSLGLAALLWFVIAGEKTSEMGLSAHLELQNFPRDLEVTGEPVDSVEVRLRASPGIIQRITPADVSAQVDLAGMQEGEHIIHLTEHSIRMPFGVKVVKISPAILTLNLERTQLRTVPVHPRLIGRPAPGFEVGELVADPAEASIAGPKSRVQEVESAFTEPVTVDGAESNVVDVVNMGLEDPLLRIQGSPRVRVTVKIQEVQQARTFDDLPLELRGGGGLVRPSAVSVTVSGPTSLLRNTAASDIKPYVDLGAATKGQEVPVAVDFAAGHTALAVKAVSPPKVLVRILRPARKAG